MEKPTLQRVMEGGKSKGKTPALPKGNKGKGKGKGNDRSQTPPPSSNGKGSESRKGNSKSKPAITQGKTVESVPKSNPPTGSTPASSSTNPATPQPKAAVNQGRFHDNVHILRHPEDVRRVTNVCTYMKWKQENQNLLYQRMWQN